MERVHAIDDLIKQVRQLISLSGTIHYDNPEYEKFHKQVTTQAYSIGFHITNDWNVIDSHLIWKPNQYFALEDANAILTALENIRLKTLAIVHDNNEPLWEYIHPIIANVSKQLLIDKHYDKAVLAAFIEIEVRLKTIRKKYKPEEKELLGSKLMENIFSDNSPILEFQCRENETGHNIQKGFMQIFSGAMTGIRNVPAHENSDIPKEESVRKLVLASLLMYKIDEAVEYSGVTE